jgi:hypothetical protein
MLAVDRQVQPNITHLTATRPNVEISQFTGLHDKNGKEVYEGDILFDKMENKKCTVVYDDNLVAFAQSGLEEWDCYFGKTRGSYLEVIGNIYENEDLLK